MNRIRFLLILLIISLLFQTCNKDDDEVVQNNHILFNDAEYGLDKGFFQFFGKLDPSDTGFNFDVYLFSSGLTFNDNQFSGSGNLIFFEMYSPVSSELATGTYTFDSNETGNSNTFDDSFFIINFDVANETGTLVDISGGTIKVTKTDTTYEFVIDLTTTDSKILTGFYKGILEQI